MVVSQLICICGRHHNVLLCFVYKEVNIFQVSCEQLSASRITIFLEGKDPSLYMDIMHKVLCQFLHKTFASDG